MHGLSTRRRLKRLEEAIAKKTAPCREAIIEIGAFDVGDEVHLVLLSPSCDPRCVFREMPGPGPQLDDFGEFSVVARLTPAEMESESESDSHEPERD